LFVHFKVLIFLLAELLKLWNLQQSRKKKDSWCPSRIAARKNIL